MFTDQFDLFYKYICGTVQSHSNRRHLVTGMALIRFLESPY